MKKTTLQDKIIAQLKGKGLLKQIVIDQATTTFNRTKEMLSGIAASYNALLEDTDKRLGLEFQDRGEFVAQLKVAGDVLVFYMHSNVFEFDREHKVWETEYVKKELSNSYAGVINIYNFLHDSFRYNRENDLGYLIARIFINRENHFFVEGKRQRGTGVDKFGKSLLTDQALLTIIETAMHYTIEFDLLVPPYDNMKIISLAQMNEEILHSRMRTGKRLGFVFNSDDVK